MINQFNIECRECRTQDVDICYDADTGRIDIRCNKCDNHEYI